MLYTKSDVSQMKGMDTLVFPVFLAGQQDTETAGETYNLSEASSGEWRHTERPCPADRPRHTAASHPGAGASAR